MTQDELDIPEFKQYDKEKYENAKSGNNRRRRKSTREECDTASSLDGYEEEYANINASNGNNRHVSITPLLCVVRFFFCLIVFCIIREKLG